MRKTRVEVKKLPRDDTQRDLKDKTSMYACIA